MTHDTLPPPVLEALNGGNKLEAIRRLREITGLGLAEARDQVYNYERVAQAQSMPVEARFAGNATAAPASIHARAGLGPGEVARGGSAGKWLALGALGAAGVLAWQLLT